MSDLENSPDQLTEESDKELVLLASSSGFSLSVLDGDPDEDLASSSFLESIVDVGDAAIDDGELLPGAPFPDVFLGVDGGVFSAASASGSSSSSVSACPPPVDAVFFMVSSATFVVGNWSPGVSFPVVFLVVDGGVSSAASATFVVGNCFASASSLFDPSSDVDAASSDVLDSLSADLDKFFFAAFLDSVPSP